MILKSEFIRDSQRPPDESLEKSLRDLEKSLAEGRASLESLKRMIQTIRGYIKQFKEALKTPAEIKEQLQEIKNVIAQFERMAKILKKLPQFKLFLLFVERTLKQMREINNELQELLDRIKKKAEALKKRLDPTFRKADSQLKKLSGQIEKGESKLKLLERKLKSLRKKMEKGNLDHFQLKELSEKAELLLGSIKQLRKQLKALESELKRYSNEAKRIMKAFKSVRLKIKKFNDQLKKASPIMAKIVALLKKMAGYLDDLKDIPFFGWLLRAAEFVLKKLEKLAKPILDRFEKIIKKVLERFSPKKALKRAVDKALKKIPGLNKAPERLKKLLKDLFKGLGESSLGKDLDLELFRKWKKEAEDLYKKFRKLGTLPNIPKSLLKDLQGLLKKFYESYSPRGKHFPKPFEVILRILRLLWIVRGKILLRQIKRSKIGPRLVQAILKYLNIIEQTLPNKKIGPLRILLGDLNTLLDIIFTELMSKPDFNLNDYPKLRDAFKRVNGRLEKLTR